MVKIYIPTPNFSMATLPDGPLKPGHALESLKAGDTLAPLHPKGSNAVVPIEAEDLMPGDIKVAWLTSLKEFLSGDFGIWALYNVFQQQAFRRAADLDRHYKRAADLDRHIKHAHSKPPSNEVAPSREHAYLNDGHQQTSQREADLDRHIKHVLWKTPDIYCCDYKRCPRSEKVVAASKTSTPQQPFGTAASLSPSSSASTVAQGASSRRDYLSAHYRDYHREDLCWRNGKEAARWFNDRNVSSS